MIHEFSGHGESSSIKTRKRIRSSWRKDYRYAPNLFSSFAGSLSHEGVLTKPDLIQEGDEDVWIKRVRNEDRSRFLKLGWYCVKLLNPTQLKANLSREEAFAQEVAFFTASKTPWSTLSMTHHNLGVQKLVGTLSNTLSDLIAKR